MSAQGEREAFARGVRAMREAAANVARTWADPSGAADSAEVRGGMLIAARIERLIRALPEPEDK